jgi:serine/threonine protein kinase
MGSVNYIAPEMQAGGGGVATAAVDIYAVGKVLYWMLSGGRIFARENHRASDIYLPNVLGEQRWEHVHALLDKTVVVEAAKRVSAKDLIALLKETERLVIGEYTPLRPSIGLVCRFCGIGKYQRYATNKGWPQGAGWLGPWARTSGTDVRVLRCDHCGHVELIDYLNIKDREWWDR